VPDVLNIIPLIRFWVHVVMSFRGTSPTSCLPTVINFQLRTAALGLIVRFGLDVPTFATRGLDAFRHARAPSGGRWNCGREMSVNFA
jgi:hypothetical protein